MKTRQTIALALLLPLLLTALLVSLLGEAESAGRAAAPAAALASEPGAHEPPQAETGAAAETDVLTLSFESDRDLRFESEKTGRLALRDLEATLRIRAVLELRVHAEREWGLVLRRIEASGTAQGRPATPQIDIVKAMGSEVLLRVDENYRVQEVLFFSDTTGPGRKIWTHIVDCMQYTFKRDEDGYDAHERDDTGTYLARYERVDHDDDAEAELERRKVRYLTIEADGAMAEIEGHSRLVVDPMPVRIEGEHTVRAVMEAAGQRVSARVRYRIECTARERRAVARPMVHATMDAADAPETKDEAHEAVARLKQAVEDYATLRDAGKGRSHEAQRAIREIVQAVRRSPAAVAAAEREFSRAPGAIAAALAAADNAASCAVIDAVLADRNRPLPERHAALMAASDFTRPSKELERTLRRIRENVPEFANSAQLALASVGDNVRRDDPQRFAGIETEVLDDLNAARTLEELTTALESVGNLGPRILPNRVAQALVDSDPVIRAAAAHALARIPLDRARDLLSQVLRHDPDAGVRRAALATVALRIKLGFDAREKLADVLRDVATQDADAALRRRAARLQA